MLETLAVISLVSAVGLQALGAALSTSADPQQKAAGRAITAASKPVTDAGARLAKFLI